MNFLYGLITFITIYLIYEIVIVSGKKRLNKFMKNSKELNIMKTKYDIDFKKFDSKYLVRMIALINSFIISITFSIVLYINNNILKLLVAFIIFVLLTIILFFSFGKYLKGKEVK